MSRIEFTLATSWTTPGTYDYPDETSEDILEENVGLRDIQETLRGLDFYRGSLERGLHGDYSIVFPTSGTRRSKGSGSYDVLMPYGTTKASAQRVFRALCGGVEKSA